MSERSELIGIVASQLNNAPAGIAVSDWRKLIKLARAHGLLQYVALYAEKLGGSGGPDGRTANYLCTALDQEIALAANQQDAVEEMQRAMEQSGIYNLVVKGAVTKRRYKNELLRTMIDIDLLYKPEQHRDFKKLMKSLGYGGYQEGRKNDVYTRPPFLTVEAHRELVESGSGCADYYRGVWSMARPKEGHKYTYEMSVEDELVFNVVHLAEHFKKGGAGVRFIIDVYVYSGIDADGAYVKRELEKLGLYGFYQNVLALAGFWFSGGESTGLVDRLADYVMEGCTFDSSENAAAIAVKDGKIKRLFKVCFPGYESMRSMFPWLGGKRLLLPCAWAVRGVRALLCRKSNVRLHMSAIRTGDAEKAKELERLYADCGL